MRIYDATGQTGKFLQEWRDHSVPYVIACTSGSTGAPKRIELLKTDMLASASATCRYFGLGKESRLLLPLSVGYIAGKMMVVRADVAGAELIVENPSNAPLLCDYGVVDLIAVVPSQLPSLIDNPLFGRIRNVIVGGAPVSPAMEARLHGLPARIFATYGMTETCSHVALRDISRGDDCYQALPGIRFSTDDRGCLVIDAPAFSFRRLVTNDVVMLRDDISFRWLGRADNVVNSGGVKLHPELIERKISHVVYMPFYLVGRPSERWGEELVMCVEGDGTGIDAVAACISVLLDRFEMPKKIMAVRQFERTASGKVIRRLPD